MKEDNVYIFKMNFNPVEMISNACSESTGIDDFGEIKKWIDNLPILDIF